METTKPSDNIHAMSYCQEIKQSKEYFHSHKTPSQTSRPTWQFSDSEQSEKADFGLAVPDSIGGFFWRSSTDRAKG